MKALDFGCLNSTTTRGTPLAHRQFSVAPALPTPVSERKRDPARLVPTPVYEPERPRPRTIGAHHAYRGDSARRAERQRAGAAAHENEELLRMRGEIQRLQEQLGVNETGLAQVLVLDDSSHVNDTPGRQSKPHSVRGERIDRQCVERSVIPHPPAAVPMGSNSPRARSSNLHGRGNSTTVSQRSARLPSQDEPRRMKNGRLLRRVERTGHYYENRANSPRGASTGKGAARPRVRGDSLHPAVAKPMNFLKRLHTQLPRADMLFPRLKTDVTQVNCAMPAW